MVNLPALPSIQIVPLTRGSVVLTAQDAYACTNAHDILQTVAALLPVDGSLSAPPMAPPPANLRPNVDFPAPGEYPPEPPASGASPVSQTEANPLYQRDNLLKLCDAWAQERITDEQFDEYLTQVCPDIGLEEAYMTRDSFGPQGADRSQLGGITLESDSDS